MSVHTQRCTGARKMHRKMAFEIFNFVPFRSMATSRRKTIGNCKGFELSFDERMCGRKCRCFDDDSIVVFVMDHVCCGGDGHCKRPWGAKNVVVELRYCVT